MAKLRIVDMDHIVLNVSDVERSVAFYTEVLGLAGERLEAFRKGEVGFPSVRINSNTVIDLVTGPAVSGARNLNHYCLVSDSIDLQSRRTGSRRGA